MPLYDLACSACGHRFEHYQSIHLPLRRDCPICKGETLEQDFSAQRLASSVCLVYGEPTTVGQQAELNRKKMGEELFRLKEEEEAGPYLVAQKKAPTPWWREPDSKPLDVSSIKDVARYVETGEKS